MSAFITMIPFTSADWDSFGAAERSKDGTEPYTNEGSTEVRIDGDLVVVVADANGISVVEAESGNMVAAASIPNVHLALFILRHMPTTLTRPELVAIGFEVESPADLYYREIAEGGWSGQ